MSNDSISAAGWPLPADDRLLKEQASKNPPIDFSKFHLLHEVFRHRGADPHQTPLMAFPKHVHDDYEYFTGQDLDRFTDCAAWVYHVSVFALSRAGYTILTLSPRLSLQAIFKLMEETDCQCLIYSDTPALRTVLQKVKSETDTQVITMPARSEYDKPGEPVRPYVRDVDTNTEMNRTATIMHSSGSTGLPKWLNISTECGFLGSSLGRPKGDKAWNYIRPPPPMLQNILPKPVSEDAYEFIFLKDYPGKVVSNSDNPPNSFHSKDIFTPHKSIPGAWKFLARLDDRITLVNGEKVLPLPMEGRIRQHALVREAVVYGIGRSIPGLLLFRAESARDLADHAFVDRIWPVIETANRHAETFSHIARDMIVPLPAGISIPMTDKGSIVRAQVYKTFEKDIDEAYKRLDTRQQGTIVLNIKELETYLLEKAQNILGSNLAGLHDDLFTLGMNSLQAIQMRGTIFRDLELGSNANKLSQNVVFEQGNVADLAQHLHNLRLSKASAKEKPIAFLEESISRYSVSVRPRTQDGPRADKNAIILTGATGGLGAQLLSQLLEQPNTKHIYCLIRGKDPLSRLQKSMTERHLSITAPEKLSVLSSDLHEPYLGLSITEYTSLQTYTTHILHCAWPVNFQLGLPSFKSSLLGLQNLLNLSLSVTSPRPARFIFCSSISVALGTPRPALVSEEPIEDLSHVSHTGYAQSKLVGEKIIEAAVKTAGAAATIYRIGQVVGDTKCGMWNDSEAFPLIIRSAMTMGALPKLDMACEWLPVDTCARSIIDIEGLDGGNDKLGKGERGILEAHGNVNEAPLRKRLVYNLRSPHTFSWTEYLLPAIAAAGLAFQPVAFAEWIQQLRNLSSGPSKSSSCELTYGNIRIDGKLSTPEAAASPEHNPALKLIDFFEEEFAPGDESSSRDGKVVFDISEAVKASQELRNAEHVIDSGLVEKMVGVWMDKWKGGEKGRAS
ncbi:MAG: hypothetical protein Q9217_001967 [Psora testacea]